MVITTDRRVRSLAYQTDNLFTVEVKPVTKEKKAEAQKAKFGYTGERLSLNFQNIEVRAVLQLIADFTGLNIVVSDTVTGQYHPASEERALGPGAGHHPQDQGPGHAPVGQCHSGRTQRRNRRPREGRIAGRQDQIEELAPLRSEFVQINYAKAADLATLIKAKENSLLSARGSVTVDERTNTLLVQDTADKLADIRKLVTALDIPVRQVLIESRIVIANDDFNRQLGVRFGATGRNDISNGRTLSTGGTLGATDTISPDAAAGNAFTGSDSQ